MELIEMGNSYKCECHSFFIMDQNIIVVCTINFKLQFEALTLRVFFFTHITNPNGEKKREIERVCESVSVRVSENEKENSRQCYVLDESAVCFPKTRFIHNKRPM